MGRFLSILQNPINNIDSRDNYRFPTSISNNFNDNYYFCGFKCKRNNNEKLFFEDEEMIKKLENCIKPLSFPVSFPTKNVSPVCLAMFMAKNSFTIVRCDETKKIILSFICDSDCSCIVEVFSFAVESYINDRLSYVLSVDRGFKHSFIIEPGCNQLMECELEDVKEDETIPLIIVMSPLSNYAPDFQQFATHLSFDTKRNCSHISAPQISLQKLIYGGNCYVIQEMYGAELSIDQEMKQSTNSNLCVPSTKNMDGSQQSINKVVEKPHPDHFIQDCVVCMIALRDTLVLPCRHLCLCSVCGEKLLHESPACPICRSTFRALLQLGNLEKYLYNSYLNTN